MNRTYKHSGKFAPIGIAGGILAGLAAGLLLAYVYAWGIIKIDEQKLACIATIAYGAAVGVAAAMGIKWGKVRNSILAGAITVLPAAMSLYWSWAFWVKNIAFNFDQTELDAMELITHPQMLWGFIKVINQEGTWGSTANDMTKGTELWLIWFAEAVCVLGVAAAVAYAMIEAQPFCEKCQLWCSSNEKLCLSPGNASFIRQSLFKRDLSFLEKLGPGNKKASHITAQLHSCPGCGDLNTLTLSETTIVPATKWYQRPGMRNTDLIKKFMLTHPEADAFRNTAYNVKQLSQAAKA